MNSQKIEKQLLCFKGAEKTFPFGPDVMVFKVMGKVFAALADREPGLCLNIKGRPDDNIVLVDAFNWAHPGYHMNKRHWVTLYLDCDIPEELLIDLISESYALVVNKLTRTQKAELQKQ